MIMKGLRLVVYALRESMSAILNVSLLLLSFWTAYGILGIILYRDRFGFCKDRLNFGISKDQVEFFSRFCFFSFFSIFFFFLIFCVFCNFAFCVFVFFIKILIFQKKCGNELWINYRYNFDNIFNAMITLFVVSTMDGWDEIMNIAANSDISKNVLFFLQKPNKFSYLGSKRVH